MVGFCLSGVVIHHDSIGDGELPVDKGGSGEPGQEFEGGVGVIPRCNICLPI